MSIALSTRSIPFSLTSFSKDEIASLRRSTSLDFRGTYPHADLTLVIVNSSRSWSEISSSPGHGLLLKLCSGAMAEEDEYVAGTIATIGSLITKPKMTEKYLKKPPFRFLHDIVMEVTKKTTFGQGLFTPEECDSGNLSDKQAKLDFLNKAISVTCFALGESIDVSANKIVAGLEPEKTNAWLQRLHAAATTCAGEKSDQAVARVQSGELVGAAKEKKKKPKEDAPPPPPAEGGDEDEAKKEEERRKRAERKKREEEKKRKEAEDAAAANEPPAPPAPSLDDEEERRKEEKRQKDEERRRRKEEERRLQEEQRRAEEAAAEAQAAEARAAEEMRRAEEAQAIAATEDFQEPPPAPPGAMSEGPFASTDEIAQRAEAALAQRAADTGRPRTAGRKPPKVTSKVTTTEQATAPSNVAAPVVIAEGAGGDDQEEDMFETGQPGAAPPPPPPPVDDGGQHGALVSDLLAEKKKEEERENRERLKKEEEETREEFDDGKGIKMKLRRKKDTGSSLAEVDPVKLGESIQSLCQAANPLGKSIDLVHQDIANMGKELDHWKQAYREASDAYTRQLKMTEDQLQPLYQKIAELDDKIAEQRSKIRNSRSRISKNDLKVQQLLESVVMVR